MNIEYQGMTYFITQKENETKNALTERGWYIAKQLPMNDEEFKKNIKKSNIYTNIKKLNCRYNTNLENIVINN